MSFWNSRQNQQPSQGEAAGAEAQRPLAETRSTQTQTPPSRGVKEENSMSMMKRDDLPAGAGPAGDLLLGHGAEFDGKLTFAGTVRIDAKFKGSIQTNDVLVVGEHARIDADITCGTVIVYGEVNGNIRAKSAVELRHPAKMRGNVESPSLSIEKGVLFNGESRQPGAARAERGPEKKDAEKKDSGAPLAAASGA